MNTLLHAPIQALVQQTEVCEEFYLILVLKISVSKIYSNNLYSKDVTQVHEKLGKVFTCS